MLEGNHRQENVEYPDEQWFYYTLAEKFGWTPDQVDNLPAGTADWLLAIASTIEQVKTEKAQG